MNEALERLVNKDLTIVECRDEIRKLTVSAADNEVLNDDRTIKIDNLTNCTVNL